MTEKKMRTMTDEEFKKHVKSKKSKNLTNDEINRLIAKLENTNKLLDFELSMILCGCENFFEKNIKGVSFVKKNGNGYRLDNLIKNLIWVMNDIKMITCETSKGA